VGAGEPAGADEPVGTGDAAGLDGSGGTAAVAGSVVRAGTDDRRAARRLRLAPWFVGVPYLVLAVGWIGFFATVESMASLGWLAAMWCACLVLLPLAVTGAVWAGLAREWGTMTWGVIAGVLCLPGFVIGVSLLPSFVQSFV
jgi:hypothetical protein